MKKIQAGRNNKKIKLLNLMKIKNLKGNLQLIKKSNNDNLKNIKEIYSLWVNKNKIKGWNYHKKMTVTLVILVGRVKVVIYDPENYIFNKFIINESKPQMLVIPPKKYFGIKNLYTKKSLLLNLADLKHSKNEYIKISLKKINYAW
jgi:dTDP-4-dehydrorhamnose 3,5-epimerase